MAAPIPLRGDFDACQHRVLARKSKDGPQARRLLALAAIYEGATRSDAAKIGGVGLQIIRDWVLRLNARGPDGLLDGKAPGQPSKLNDAQRHAVARMIETGPIPPVHGVVRWRLIDLAPWVIANSRHDRVTIRKQRARLRILKKLPHASGNGRARARHRRRRDRNLVRR